MQLKIIDKNIHVIGDAPKADKIIFAYREMDNFFGFSPKYVFGLSGGIDSSLACALAVRALGKERIIAYNFPSEFNSEKTKNSAKKLAENLGIEYNIVPITDIQKEVENAVLGDHKGSPLHGHPIPPVVKENIQAKIRYTDLLSNFAQIHGGVMTCNGNKLEIAVGYCTLYGDSGGAFAPIGDLLKTEVFEIARTIEEIPRELIPNEDLEFEDWQIYPSAELAKNQKDPMKFGYHDRLLDAISNRKFSFNLIKEFYKTGELFSILNLSQKWIERYNLNDSEIFEQDLQWFFNRIKSSEFKRWQMPPVVRV